MMIVSIATKTVGNDYNDCNDEDFDDDYDDCHDDTFDDDYNCDYDDNYDNDYTIMTTTVMMIAIMMRAMPQPAWMVVRHTL